MITIRLRFLFLALAFFLALSCKKENDSLAGKNDADLKAAKDQLAITQQDLNSSEKKVSDLNKQIETLTADVQKFKKELEAVQRNDPNNPRIAELEKEVARLKKDLEAARQRQMQELSAASSVHLMITLSQTSFQGILDVSAANDVENNMTGFSSLQPLTNEEFLELNIIDNAMIELTNVETSKKTQISLHKKDKPDAMDDDYTFKVCQKEAEQTNDKTCEERSPQPNETFSMSFKGLPIDASGAFLSPIQSVMPKFSRLALMETGDPKKEVQKIPPLDIDLTKGEKINFTLSQTHAFNPGSIRCRVNFIADEDKDGDQETLVSVEANVLSTNGNRTLEITPQDLKQTLCDYNDNEGVQNVLGALTGTNSSLAFNCSEAKSHALLDAGGALRLFFIEINHEPSYGIGKLTFQNQNSPCPESDDG